MSYSTRRENAVANETPIPPVSKALRDKLEGKLDRMEEISEKAHLQWRLWLTAGNGAGLVVTGGALINAWKMQPFLVLLPALWLFAIGLLSGGALAYLSRQGFSAMRAEADASVAKHDGAIRTIERSGTRIDIDQVIRRARKRVDLFARLEGAFEPVSSLAFASGVLWPLIQVTFFYAAPGT